MRVTTYQAVGERADALSQINEDAHSHKYHIETPILTHINLYCFIDYKYDVCTYINVILTRADLRTCCCYKLSIQNRYCNKPAAAYLTHENPRQKKKASGSCFEDSKI